MSSTKTKKLLALRKNRGSNFILSKKELNKRVQSLSRVMYKSRNELSRIEQTESIFKSPIPESPNCRMDRYSGAYFTVKIPKAKNSPEVDSLSRQNEEPAKSICCKSNLRRSKKFNFIYQRKINKYVYQTKAGSLVCPKYKDVINIYETVANKYKRKFQIRQTFRDISEDEKLHSSVQKIRSLSPDFII